METMEEIHAIAHDDYGLKASGCLHSLEKFNTLFGFKLTLIFIGTIEKSNCFFKKKRYSYSGRHTSRDCIQKNLSISMMQV